MTRALERIEVPQADQFVQTIPGETPAQQAARLNAAQANLGAWDVEAIDPRRKAVGADVASLLGDTIAQSSLAAPENFGPIDELSVH